MVSDEMIAHAFEEGFAAAPISSSMARLPASDRTPGNGWFRTAQRITGNALLPVILFRFGYSLNRSIPIPVSFS